MKTDTITYQVDGNDFSIDVTIDIAIHNGSSGKIVLIVPGIDGSLDGYENKYKIMAENLVKNHNTTVIRMTNPHVPGGGWIDNLYQVLSYIQNNLCASKSTEIYIIGHSLGAYLAGCIAYEFEDVKKILLINPATKIDLRPFIYGLENFSGENIVVIGENDPGRPMMEDSANLFSTIKVIDNADHNFSGEAFEIFLNLPELLFTNNI